MSSPSFVDFWHAASPPLRAFLSFLVGDVTVADATLTSRCSMPSCMWAAEVGGASRSAPIALARAGTKARSASRSCRRLTCDGDAIAASPLPARIHHCSALLCCCSIALPCLQRLLSSSHPARLALTLPLNLAVEHSHHARGRPETQASVQRPHPPNATGQTSLPDRQLCTNTADRFSDTMHLHWLNTCRACRWRVCSQRQQSCFEQ